MKTAAISIFTYFLFLIILQNKIGSIMGSFYSTDNIAMDNIHIAIACNIEKP